MLSAVIEYIPVLLMTFMRAPSSDSSVIESEDIPQDCGSITGGKQQKMSDS